MRDEDGNVLPFAREESLGNVTRYVFAGSPSPLRRLRVEMDVLPGAYRLGSFGMLEDVMRERGG